jgi:hypothetical protein
MKKLGQIVRPAKDCTMRHKPPPMTRQQIDAVTPFLDIFTQLGYSPYNLKLR